MSLAIGSSAPEFKLFSTEKTEVSLSSFKGKKVVVLFFPLAFTGVCTTELCSLRDDIASYNNVGAEVIAISVDSLFTLEKFKEEQKLPFLLLSDFNKEASQAYDSYYADFVLGMKGVSKRSVFVINEAGNVVHSEILDNAGEIPDFNKVKAALA